MRKARGFAANSPARMELRIKNGVEMEQLALGEGGFLAQKFMRGNKL